MIFSIRLLKQIQKNKIGLNCRFVSGLNLWNEELSSELKQSIEKHWKDKLRVEKYDENDNSREKYYVLSMFPYPSGSLHMGHVRVYTISDAIARFQRMNGKNVIHPIGWDAFGLPAENAAIERQIPPNEWTQTNIKQMKSQLKRLGCTFEWDRELATCDPTYYKWTQALFLKLYDAGLVYRKKAIVNWDPVDRTVLADEQVDENGCSWRSGAKVEKKALQQWFVKTTRFAKNLQDGLDDPQLEDWRDIIKLQKHWIGDCNGVIFNFKIANTDDFMTLWTPKPEAINNTKFVAINSKHILSHSDGIDVQPGIKKLNHELINPFNGEQIPIYLTDAQIEFLPFTDSFVGMPNTCEQSKAFAEKFHINYDLKVTIDNEICEKALKLNVGGYWSSAKLRDWLISRQRFWGTPIPIAYCDSCGIQPIRSLPVELSERTFCPNCQKPAKRETDTMDTFVDSSWYYLRYLDSKNSDLMFDLNKVKKGMPVDLYIGGKEHAVLHLYYARFIGHFLHSIGLLEQREPFKRLLVQGMIMGLSYRLKGTGKYVSADQVDIIDKKKNKAAMKDTGDPVVISWEKMSKSKYNGVDPDDMFNEYGIDTTRLLVLADVAPTSHRHWNSNTFPGILNWQKRLWLTIRDFIIHRTNLPPAISDDQFSAQDNFMYDSRNYYLKGVTFNYCISQQHSVAISKQQGLTNSIRKAPPFVMAKSQQFERALATQIILLAPMAPFFASELWSGFLSAPGRLSSSEEIDWEKTVLEQKWPIIDACYEMDIICKVNGVELSVIKLAKKDLDKLSKDEAIAVALQQKEISMELEKKTIKNVQYIAQENYDSIVHITTRRKKNEANLKLEDNLLV